MQRQVWPLTLVLAALWTTPALPQSDQNERPQFLAQPPQGTFKTSKLIGLRVIGQDHVRAGKIEDVLFGADGHIQAVVIDVGGFLGIGTKRVAVPFAKMAWNTDARAGEGPDPSIVKPENAPSADAAASAGPETMPGAKTSSAALQAENAANTGEATGSAQRADASRGRATIEVGEPTEGEVRMTKAELQAAPAFSFDATERH